MCVSLSKWLTKFERMLRWKVMLMANGGVISCQFFQIVDAGLGQWRLSVR